MRGDALRRLLSAFLFLLATAFAATRAHALSLASRVSAAVGDTAHRAPRRDGAAKGTRRKKKTTKRRETPPKRAKVGERVPVEITYYCLQGTTRTDQPTREGIIAADPRVFPLRRHVELFLRGKSLGRFLVDDTGGRVRGHVVDVWVPSCGDARRRGRRRGSAVLLERGAVVEKGLAGSEGRGTSG